MDWARARLNISDKREHHSDPRTLQYIAGTFSCLSTCCTPSILWQGLDPLWQGLLEDSLQCEQQPLLKHLYLQVPTTQFSASKQVISFNTISANLPALHKFSPPYPLAGLSASPWEASWPVSTTRLRTSLSPGCCFPGQRRGLSAFRPHGWGPAWGTVASGPGWMALAGTGRPGIVRPSTGLTVWWWGTAGDSDWQSGATLLVTIF